jgi:hypothetical protein
MAINPVSSSAGAAAQAVQQPKPQQAETPKADASRSADEAARKRQAEQQQPEQAKPVVNAEGQKTGQVINVTA